MAKSKHIPSCYKPTGIADVLQCDLCRNFLYAEYDKVNSEHKRPESRSRNKNKA